MHSGSLGNIHDEIYVGVVVVVAASGYLDVPIRHPDVFGVDPQILRGGHDGKLDGAFVAKGLVGPFPDRTDLLDGGDTVVGDEDLCILDTRFWSAHRVFGLNKCRNLLADLGDDGVTVMGLDPVWDLAGGGILEGIPTCGMRS
jgi:hypothetical protein